MKILRTVFFVLIVSGCSWFQKPKLPEVPVFNETRSLESVLEQEKMGPRFVESPGHEKVQAYILQNIQGAHQIHKNFGEMPLKNTKIPVRNYMAQLWPNKKQRILFSAHYDTRPFADKDPKEKTKPILGANDGGSGVAVLIEIYKNLQPLKDFPVGVDFMFWDAEDLGTSEDPSTYCLGSQFWANSRVPVDYEALVNVNFDMVGRMGAVFPIEVTSWRSASRYVELFWKSAKTLGYGAYFSDEKIGPITDDHTIVWEIAGIPALDIIHMSKGPKFPEEWHTLSDTSAVISRDTLKAVGQSALHFLWTVAAEQNQ